MPYSENAVVTEYFDRHTAYGTDWFTVTTLVDDSNYLTQPFITTTHFKKEADGSSGARRRVSDFHAYNSKALRCLRSRAQAGATEVWAQSSQRR